MHVRAHNPVVAVLRQVALPISETFIAEQLQAMSRYDPVIFARQLQNTDVFGLPSKVVIRSDSSLIKRLEDYIYLISRSSPTFDRAFEEHKPALVHAHFGLEGIYGLKLKAKFGIPLVVTFHGADVTARRRRWDRPRVGWWMYERYRDELIEKGDLFIAVSSAIRSRLIKYGFPEDRTVVHHIGVDTTRLRYLQATSNSEPQTVVTVGRLVEKKGTIDLIRAFRILSENLPNIRLQIIGDGPLRGLIDRYIAETELEGKVQLLGALPYQATQQLVQEADVFCLPSKTARNGDTEGLPISILEAMALGTPVVSTVHSGIPDAVENGKSGLLVSEGDSGALSRALSKLLSDEGLRQDMARAARVRIEKLFDIRQQSAILEDYYDNLRHKPR